MTTDILTILEMAVDGAGILICVASILLILRSRRICGPQTAFSRARPTDFHSIMERRSIGQAAENAFSAIIAAVDLQQKRFMTALDGGEPPSFSEKFVAPIEDASPADRVVPSPSADLLSPAAMALARKIQQRQKDCRRN